MKIKYTQEPGDTMGLKAFYEVTRDQVPRRDEHVKIGDNTIYRVSLVTWNEPHGEHPFVVVRLQSI
jgi:hypothetical protein